MEFVMTILEGAWRYVTTIRIADYLDIALMAYCCYLLLRLVRSTRAESLVKGIMVFLLALWISHVFKLNGIYFILNHMLDVGILALIVLFQPEIRRILEQVGSSKLRSFIPFAAKQQSSAIENAIAQTVLACTEMSKTRTGVLIVFEREINLDEMARTGTIVDAQVSSELLKNIFFVKAAMHDGAVIIRDGRILAGGCMLPLSKNVNLSRDLGMRHRAGIGMSENSDAVVVIVSEETGTISVAIGGLLKRHLKPETLEKLLINELMADRGTGSGQAAAAFAAYPEKAEGGRRRKWSKLKAAGRFASACRSSLRCSFGSTPTTARRSRCPSTMCR